MVVARRCRPSSSPALGADDPGRLHDAADVGWRHQLLDLDRSAARVSRRQPGVGPRRRNGRAPRATRSNGICRPVSVATRSSDAPPALRSRLREQKSIRLAARPGRPPRRPRESRKAVIAVTMGWRLFTENEQRMTDQGTKGRIGGLPPSASVRTGSWGRPSAVVPVGRARRRVTTPGSRPRTPTPGGCSRT